MVDYDGQDALKTFLNALAWTALTEPTYFFYQDTKTQEIPNTIIIQITSLTTERMSETEYALHHKLSVRYDHSTKVNGWANFKYILTNLWTLSSSNAFYSQPGDISIYYTELRKSFLIPITYTELIAM